MKKAKALLMALMVLPGGGPTTRVIDKEHDDPAKITHNDQIEMNLKQIDAKSRRSVSLVSSPWSDVTWKANKGLLAERFNDPNFEKKGDWREKSKYLNRYSASWVLSLEPEKRERWIAALSKRFYQKGVDC